MTTSSVATARAQFGDAHRTGPDLPVTEGDAALGIGCYNVSTVKIHATILKQDASTVSIDLSTLTSYIARYGRMSGPTE